MKLTVFNGSPRLGANNTQLMVDAFSSGFQEIQGNHGQVVFHKLNKMGDGGMDAAVKAFEEAECILLAFPLYSYAMPAGVKAFIEALAEHIETTAEEVLTAKSEKKLGFLVQYGFREAVHARPLEKYLEELPELLGCRYMGTVIKGGCDGLYKNPRNSVNQKILAGVREIGKSMGEEGVMDKTLLNQYALPEKESPKNVWVMKLVMGLINQLYWKAQLKKNGAVARSFDKPYAPESFVTSEDKWVKGGDRS